MKLTGKEMQNLEFQKVNKTQNNNTWTPREKGDTIIGEYVELKENVGMDNYTIYVLRDTNDEEVSVFGKTALNSQMKKVEIGDIIKITYEGEKRSQRGRTYKDFKVYKAITN